MTRFVIMLAFIAIVTPSSFSDEPVPAQAVELDSLRLIGAVVEISSNGPQGAFSLPALTLNADKTVAGSEAVIDMYRNALRSVVPMVQVNVSQAMVWSVDGNSLTFTWAIELKSTNYLHSITQKMILTPDPERKTWKGQYSDVVVTNGVTSPAHHETPLTAAVKLSAKTDETDKKSDTNQELSTFNRDVERLIKELLTQAGGNAAKAQQLAEALRNERGNDAVSVAVEHYLFGLWWHDHTLGIFQLSPVPAVTVAGWELINWAWLEVIGRPADNPAFTFWGVNWGAGLLNPGDRGDHWSEIIFWGTAGSYGFRPQLSPTGGGGAW